jgi:hypothetical protein
MSSAEGSFEACAQRSAGSGGSTAPVAAAVPTFPTARSLESIDRDAA